MIEIRIHGRGGQGNVVGAYILATAAIGEGRYAQAFPAFGAERRGAPVAAFVRLAEAPIRRRCQVAHPAFVIVQDETLLASSGPLEGMLPEGAAVINSARDARAIAASLGCAVYALPATQLSQEMLGRPMPNTALLAALLALTRLLPLGGLKNALAQRFKGDVLERNLALIDRVAVATPACIWEERVHAAST